MTGARAFAHECGKGHVVRIDVPPELIGTHPRLDIPAIKLDELDRALTHAMVTEAEFRTRTDDVEIARAEASMGLHFPARWRAYLQKGAWFGGGWMATGAYVWLYLPSESAACVRAWAGFADDRPGMIVIGSDGGGEMITVDAREPDPPVTLTPAVSLGWEDSLQQSASIEEFVQAIENNSFDFVFSRTA